MLTTKLAQESIRNLQYILNSRNTDIIFQPLHDPSRYNMYCIYIQSYCPVWTTQCKVVPARFSIGYEIFSKTVKGKSSFKKSQDSENIYYIFLTLTVAYIDTKIIEIVQYNLYQALHVFKI